jgi:hypothetical protein
MLLAIIARQRRLAHSKDEAEVGEQERCERCDGAGIVNRYQEPELAASTMPCPDCSPNTPEFRKPVGGSLSAAAAANTPERPEQKCRCGRAWPHQKHRTWGCFTPERPEEQERVTADWRDLPPGVYEGANRYSTDDEEVLTLWRDGKTWDVRVDREVERIKDEAAERLREAFYTDGLLSQFRRTAGEGFREAFDVVFQDAMILTEPGKAEQVPSSTHPKARARRRGRVVRVSDGEKLSAGGERVHTYPTNDLMEHELEGEDCPCGPEVVPVPREDGSMGWQVVHHSLDGREL